MTTNTRHGVVVSKTNFNRSRILIEKVERSLIKIDYKTLFLAVTRQMIKNGLSHKVFTNVCFDYVLVSMPLPLSVAGTFFYHAPKNRVARVIAKKIVKLTIKIPLNLCVSVFKYFSPF